MRGESRRGRGKGRGGASYRGRKPSGPITALGAGGLQTAEPTGGPVAPPQQPTSRPSPQPVTQPMPVQQQPMTPMPFYADPNRFPTPVWQADPSQVSGWQGQFIQQIPSAGQPIDTYQQYPNGIYQATYQQPAFETNAFYTGAVQVLTPTNTRPPSVPNQQAQMVPPRPNSNYAHTPSPSPATQTQQQPQQQQSQQQQNANRQYQDYNQFGSGASANEGSQSRPSSVNSAANQNPPTPNQNYQQGNQQSQQQAQQGQQQQTVYTTVSAANFSPGSNVQQTQFVNASSGNGQPGYPQVNTSSPQVVSHNSSGYPGNDQYSGQQNQQWQQADHEQMMWDRQSQHQQHQMHENKMDQRTYQQTDQQAQYMTQQSNEQSENTSPTKMRNDGSHKTFSQADKVNLNTRIKTMILNKQQNDAKMEQEMKNVEQNQATGHFLWYSHHHHLDPLGVDGGLKKKSPNYDERISNNTHIFAQTNVKSTGLNNTYELPIKSSRLRTSVKTKNHGFSQNNNQLDVKTDPSKYPNCEKKEPAQDTWQKPMMVEVKQELNEDYRPTSNSVDAQSQQAKYSNEYEENKTVIKKELDISSPGCRTPQSPSISSVTSPYAHCNFGAPHSPSVMTPPSPMYPSSTGSPVSLGREQKPINQRSAAQTSHGFWPLHTKTKPDQNFRTPHASDLGSYDQMQFPVKTEGVFVSPERTKMWLHEKKKELSSAPQKPPDSSGHVKSKSTEKPDKSPPKVVGERIPQCHCFPPDQSPPEPGTYYTHLGCANSLRTLRHNLECQTGLTGPAIRIEKVRYTGKEGKTAQGCPIVKWVHRRVSIEEKYLVIVKHRTGHTCQSAFIVVCLVVWEGVSKDNADELYALLTDKLNKFGLPTKRRCSTNDPRTCACQGINENTCGASFSFGCSWSMYYNGCKFTRSKEVRKFRLSVKEEETMIEEKLQNLADHVSPIYRSLAPQSFQNQIGYENVAPECRLGTNFGRPFSGVTACMDFCAHSHKDIHNMNNGCTVVVTLTKHRDLSKPEEEQLHVLPLYIPDDTDEFGSKENQDMKTVKGEIEVLNKYECEVCTFSEPAEKCRIRKGKREESQRKRKSSTSQPSSPSVSSTSFQHSPKESASPFSSTSEIQSGHVSSTVLDSPIRNHGWRYDNFNKYENSTGVHSNGNNFSDHLPQFSVFKTPYSYNPNVFSNHYNQEGYLNDHTYPQNPYSAYNNPYHATPNLFTHFNPQPYRLNNPFDDFYSNHVELKPNIENTTKYKSVDIKYTDNSECFRDSEIGGVAIALSHGSVLIECAKHELHATTALRKPDRTNPTRISLVFYQHRSLNKSQHGLDDYTSKQKIKLEGAQPHPVDFDSSFDSSSLMSSLDRYSSEVVLRAATLPTCSITTMFPMYPCMVTGAYQEPYAGTK